MKKASPLPVLLCMLVALSGAAGLIYELLFIRALGLHFGTATPAVTTVVATFMAGLAFGNLWFGKRADRSPRPFALYRRLELSIALTGLTASLAIVRGGVWLDALARLCAAAGPLQALATACVFSLCMLPPAIAMGGTLPVLARAVSRRSAPGRALSILYACNTLGALAGTLLPDFVLIPHHGLTLTACAAGALNLVVAVAVGRYVRDEAESTRTLELPAAAPSLTSSQRAALMVSACTGFGTMALEVLWSRTLQHWAAALVTSFAVLLAVYLAAVSLGTLIAQRFAPHSQRPLRTALGLLGLTGVAALAPLAYAPMWRDLERALWPRPAGLRRLGLLREAGDALLHAVYLEAAVALLMGATFPFIAAAWLADGKPGLRTGQLFVVNTLSGVLGAVLIGFVGLPVLGEQTSYCAISVLLVGVAALCAVRLPRSGDERRSSALPLTCLAAVLTLTVWLPDAQLFRAHFRSGGEVIAVEQGATTTAAAAARYLYGEAYYAELLTPGISMSSTRADARRYMSLMAHAALLSARTAERALLICYGVGNTARALLAHPGVQRLDVVDISPEVLALGQHFAAARESDPLRDARTHVFVDDGRHHLITRALRYDVITAEPPPPNYAGVVNLYSREFYRLAKQRLRPGGVITQWLPVFQLADSDVRAVIAAFVAELPHSALLYGYEEQLILIGSLEPIAIDARTRHEARASVSLSNGLRADYLGDLDDLLGSVLQTDAELRRAVAGVEPLSDEHPTLQYPYRDVRDGTFYSARFTHDPSRAFSLLPDADAAERAQVLLAWRATATALTALPLRAGSPREARELRLGRLLQPALDARPDNEGLRALLAIDHDRMRLAQLALQRPGASILLAQPRRRDSAHYLVLQDALWMLARRAFYHHDYARALELLGQLTPEAPDAALHALLTAGCLRALGQATASAAAFRAAAATSSDAWARAELLLLAEQAQQPYPSSRGPWSRAHDAER